MSADGYLRVTQVLALSGCVDYSWCDEEGKWRGSEVHRAVELANKGKLKSVPEKISGYFASFEKFKRECRWIAVRTEQELKDERLKISGRMDASGWIKGELAVVDFKTSAIRPAAALQLALYGHMLFGNRMFPRASVELGADGEYKLKIWKILDCPADVSTALASVRIARWRLQKGLATI